MNQPSQPLTRLSREVRMFLPMDSLHRNTKSTSGKKTAEPGGGKRNRWMSVLPVSLWDPYVVIKIAIDGIPDPQVGILVDIRVMDRWVKEAVLESMELFNQNASLPSSYEKKPLIDDWLPQLFQLTCKKVTEESEFHCKKLEIAFSPYLRFSIDSSNTDSPQMPQVQVTQQFEFSAAHRLHCNKLSDAQNKILFGKCNHPSGHGHNYILEVTCSLPTPKDSGESPKEPWDWMNEIVDREVLSKLDHKFLNNDLPEFQELNPTVENIAALIHLWLNPHFDSHRPLAGVRLYETEKTWAEVGFS